jgi:hypothetical protein
MKYFCMWKITTIERKIQCKLYKICTYVIHSSQKINKDQVLSLLTLQSPAVTICTASFNTKTFVFCLHRVISWLVWFFQQWQSHGSTLFSVRYEPNHKMHINFSLWRVQRDTRLETYATGQYALRFTLGSICFVISGRSLVICKVYVPLFRDVEFLELPVLKQQWKNCTAQQSDSHVHITKLQWCVSSVKSKCLLGQKSPHDLHPRLHHTQSLIPKNLTKTAKNETSHFHNGKFHSSKALVYAIPRCSFD